MEHDEEDNGEWEEAIAASDDGKEIKHGESEDENDPLVKTEREMLEHEPDGSGGDEPADVVNRSERKTEFRERHDEEIPREEVSLVFHAVKKFKERAIADSEPGLRFVFPAFVELDGDESDDEINKKDDEGSAVGF